MAGLWQHRDIVENVFTLDDLLDANEILAVKAENECLSYEASQKER